MDLAQTYRPAAAEEMIGGEEYAAAVESALASGAHSFLLVGPSGCGKTTLARCIAASLGDSVDILEIDAASSGRVEDARELKRMGEFPSMLGARVIILDECHAATPQAWQALLKILEEPAEGVYWCLCTTEESKLPSTILTRCARIQVRPATDDELVDHLEYVAREEGMEPADGVIGVAARMAFGSVRMALQHLGTVAGAESRAAAAELLQAPEDRKQTIDLCRLLMAGADYRRAMEMLDAFGDADAESVRLGLVHYAAKVARGSDGRKAERALAVLEAFERPCNRGEKLVPIVLGVGRLTMGS